MPRQDFLILSFGQSRKYKLFGHSMTSIVPSEKIIGKSQSKCENNLECYIKPDKSRGMLVEHEKNAACELRAKAKQKDERGDKIYPQG